MTKKQVFTKITSPLKWYQGYCSSGYASELKRKFHAGILGEVAISNLFEYFGYKIKKEELWEKR